MKVLFIGDIVGRIGRRIVKEKLPYFAEKYGIDFVIANGENATHGKGLTQSHYLELIDSGIDVITLGNHYNSKNDIVRYIDRADRLIRPCNLTCAFPGEGSAIYDIDNISLRITNVLGSVFINESVSSPYYSVYQIIEGEETSNIHIIDFHGEATSEKLCFANALDGKVSAIIGTHTHVQTRDYRILPNGTAYISDVGMCGLYDGIIGFEKKSVINKTIFGDSCKFEIPNDGQAMFNAVVVDIDESTGKAIDIFPIYYVEDLKNENSNN